MILVVRDCCSRTAYMDPSKRKTQSVHWTRIWWYSAAVETEETERECRKGTKKRKITRGIGRKSKKSEIKELNLFSLLSLLIFWGESKSEFRGLGLTIKKTPINGIGCYVNGKSDY